MPVSAPISAIVIACLGPMCSYTAPADRFETVASCERAAVVIAGASRAGMVQAFWVPGDTRRRTSFQCLDAQTGDVLSSYDSDAELARR